ncbi:type II toxin-antitoxin system PemK/MazF family toxin [Actinoplanes sp. NPDC024001]|uniref:type II toxin-antitoxin system PemK/MazF family toxin n=1 Tax=Actinoplanes sp. NPDC024001 TaxID=3154598 RepID=UPI0033C64668
MPASPERPTGPAPSRPTPSPSARPAPARPATTRRPPRQVPRPRGGRHLAYAPDLDGDADPGEIVWTWVPYEDDPAQGKDRPVLVVGRDGRTLLGLMLSSQSERDGQRHWLALGPGDWDRSARPSWVRLDRVLEVEEDGIRREGAVLDRPRFDRVAAILRRNYGWP